MKRTHGFLALAGCIAALLVAVGVVGPTALAATDTSAEEVARYLYKWGSRGPSKGHFNRPTGIDLLEDSTGQTVLVIADTGNHRLRNYTHDGMFIDKWGTEGSGSGEFRSPVGVAVTADNHVWVADSANHRLQKTEISSRSLRRAPGTLTDLFDGDQAAPFGAPVDVAVDGDGNLYVVDREQDRVQKFAPSGELVKAWGGHGDGEGELDRPTAVAVDGEGNVLVADSGNDRVQKFDADGRFLMQWGTSGSNGGEFRQPTGVAVDRENNVYVADSHNHRIQKFDAEGRYLGWAGGEGSDDGQLLEPYGVVVDSQGRIYVTDSGNHRIQVFTQQ